MFRYNHPMIKKLLKRLFFNIRYIYKPPWDSGTTSPEVINFIEHSPPGRALDLGAGTGTNIITLAKAGWEAVGVEYAILAVHLARQKFKQHHIKAKMVLGDVANLDFLIEPFDLILDIGCFHSLIENEKESYRKNLLRLLKPKGIYLLYSFLISEGDNRVGITKKDIEKFSKLLDRKFSEIGSERGIRQSIWLKFQN